jgi:hypothetical protein
MTSVKTVTPEQMNVDEAGLGPSHVIAGSKMVKSADHTVIAVPPTKKTIANPQLSKSTSVESLVMLIVTTCKNFSANSVPSQIS